VLLNLNLTNFTVVSTDSLLSVNNVRKLLHLRREWFFVDQDIALILFLTQAFFASDVITVM